jgi:hypothetical protein
MHLAQRASSRSSPRSRWHGTCRDSSCI